jgi:hypothetical protein
MKTPRNRFFEELDRAVDWQEIGRVLEQAGYDGTGDSFSRIVLLKIVLVQHCYSLSNARCIELLEDRASWRHFVGLKPKDEIPDKTVLERFRGRLEKNGIHIQLLKALRQQLHNKGLVLKQGISVEAALVELEKNDENYDRSASNGSSTAVGPRKTAFLLLSHAIGTAILDEYAKISKAVAKNADFWLLFHKKTDNGTLPAKKFRSYVFTDRSLAILPYQTFYENAIVPGSAHFPLMLFFHNFPDHDYYWIIEGDVRFSGKWKSFFDAFETSDSDFLTCKIRHYVEDPEWYWWPTLSHPKKEIPLAKCVASFNPIYRISRRALEYIHQMHVEGWRGHFEVLIPTLLFHGGFRLRDIGGDGTFVKSGERHRFYTGETMNFRPALQRIGSKRLTLYHPVKCG